ncbi:MAG: ribonuclease H-like domain-containing protein [Candidatus Micrarchaeota archaeon]
MLEGTFVHLPNIDTRRERRLWAGGIHSWDDFIERFSDSPYHHHQCSILESSREALKRLDGNYFGDLLPDDEAWRCFPHFKKIAYLDIETTGLAPDSDYVTVIGVYDGEETHSYIHGENLEQFAKDIARYEMVVTFNGSQFDIPFLKKHIPGVKIPRLHADLRFILASLDVRGGLKKIEQRFGFKRDDDLRNMNGYGAVILWQQYLKSKNPDVLDRLVRYNAADICNLQKLLEWAYKEKRGRTGFDELRSVAGKQV